MLCWFIDRFTTTEKGNCVKYGVIAPSTLHVLIVWHCAKCPKLSKRIDTKRLRRLVANETATHTLGLHYLIFIFAILIRVVSPPLLRLVGFVRILAANFRWSLRRRVLMGDAQILRRRPVGLVTHRITDFARIVAILRQSGCNGTYGFLIFNNKDGGKERISSIQWQGNKWSISRSTWFNTLASWRGLLMHLIPVVIRLLCRKRED